ncbi:phosphotransferase family protein [Amycolatopsis acididurans]|uniref:phosphotransferase family protein n=1 Tax=Amycolatopsis acididurans TaxID=2724524 RepID=UPI001B33D360|nr:phosphotransferase family protein [Amycolatopsis acididurans]
MADAGRWFRARFVPAVEDLTVERVARVSRGVSRETWIVDATVVRDGRPAAESFVVRRDLPDGSVIPMPLREEFEVYRRLAGSSVPTTRALWFEDDPEWQPDGRAAYVRTKVDGHWRLDFLEGDDPGDDERKIAASKEHLDKLALVHTTDWRALGFGAIGTVPASAAECATALVDDLTARLSSFQFEPSPAVAEGLAQLRAGAPTDSPVIALCKGTNGHGEEVWSGGRIVAMSDWELWRLGDPAYDFAQLQDMVPEIVRDGRRVWGWPEALGYYRDRTGIEITPERLGWYRACYGLIQFSYAHHSAYRLRRGAGSIRLAWNATEVQYRSQLKLAAAFGFTPG